MKAAFPTTPEIIAISGNGAAGKDTIAQIFVERGYTHISTSNIVREIIIQGGEMPSRELQNRVANAVRAERGAAYFVIEALARNPLRPVVLSGIYAPAEGEYVKSQKGLLLHVQASEGEETSTLLYERIAKRQDGSRDNLNVAEFHAAYQRENSGNLDCEANVSRLRRMADFCICTAGCQANNYEQVDQFLMEFSHA